RALVRQVGRAPICAMIAEIIDGKAGGAMANPEHLEIRKKGVEQWNHWRKDYHKVFPDLTDVNLHQVNLSGANLSKADLSRAVVSRANLSGVTFNPAILNGANLSGTDLTGVDFNHATMISVN